MKVICNSIGSVASNSLMAQSRECYLCGASTPHDDSSCEPCPWNKDAKCIPVDPEGEKLKRQDPELTALYALFAIWTAELVNTGIL